MLKASLGSQNKKLRGARLRLLAADPGAAFDRWPALQLNAGLRSSWQRCYLKVGCFLPMS